MLVNDVQDGKNPTSITAENATTLLEIIKANPGRSANAYARMLGWTHSDTRRLLAVLEHLGDIDSRVVRAYHVPRREQQGEAEAVAEAASLLAAAHPLVDA